MTSEVLPPSPLTTLAIILGASEWPRSLDNFQASEAFENAAMAFLDYLLDSSKFGLPTRNLLNLFNSDQGPDDIDTKIGRFLDRHISEMKKSGNAARDLIVYFVGHGGFTRGDLDYYLAIRRTRMDNPLTSSIPIRSLAYTIKEKARHLRRFIILDCCFAASASKFFQAAEPTQVSIKQTIDAFKVQDIGVGFPAKGTSLLCSSRHNLPSLISPDNKYTMFSEALLHALRVGDPHLQAGISLRTVARLAEDFLHDTYSDQGAPRPEIHSPDQSEGDLADIPFFPNPVTAQPPSLAPERPLDKPQQPQRVISRRTVVIGLAGLAVVGVAGGGIALLSHTQGSHISSTPPVSSINSSGAMFGFDLQHTHFNPDEHLISSANVSLLVPYWTAKTRASIYASPVVANGRVYVGSYDFNLYALNATTGEILWAAPTTSQIVSSPAVANEMVYVGEWDGVFYAFDALTGKQRWKVPTHYVINQSSYVIESSPTVANGVVYIGSDDFNLSALDAATGTLLWVYKTDDYFASSPAVANGVVYVGSNDFKVYAFDARTGHIRWTTRTGSYIGSSSPAVANGVVYVGSYDHKLYAFNALTGVLLWTATTGDIIRSSPAVANGRVFVGSDDHKLYAFNALTGVPLWTATTGDIIKSSPMVANGVVYVGSGDHKLYAFDEAPLNSGGNLLWTATTGDKIESSPMVVNGVVYVGSADGKLYAFHLHGGQP